MKKILLSTALILFVGGAMALGGTGAFFSDTELSSGNTFAAGDIDLKIDNSSYYNGVVSSTTSWSLVDLTVEKFFNFLDLKPGDYGEDTISFHVDTNDAYLCANVTLTSNDDNGINEPEAEDGDVTPGVGEGELAQNVNFMWWADDGDNVLETGENVISSGPIGNLTLNQPFPFALADSDENIWTGVGGPVKGDETLYIGKAWCFGDITPSPLAQSSLGSRATSTPAEDGNGNQLAGEPADGGYLCNGSKLNNITQTDSLTADVSFSAVQSRHNSTYQCKEPRGTLVVIKHVINDNGGTAVAGNFSLIVNGTNTDPAGQFPGQEDPGTVVTLDPGVYGVAESVVAGYTQSFSQDCSGSIAAGETKTCTVTNNDNAPLACEVIHTYADEVVSSDQGLRKNGTLVTADRSNTSYALGAPQSLGTPYDNPVTPNSFFALGFPLQGNTAEIILSFNNNFVVNGAGNDLKLWEVTGGTSYPDERVDVYVGNNPIGPWTLVGDNVTRDAEIDIAPIAQARYVRIVDASNLALFEDTADGYDLDAVQALNCVQRVLEN